MKKILCLVLIILLLSSLFLFYFEKSSNASYSNKFSNYPGYNELIEDLQKEHPNWEFEILETGLEWKDVLEAETIARHGRSLISKYDIAYDRCSKCGSKQYETGWYCASVAAVSYYLDPRNSICEDYIFQFEQLTYDSKNQNVDGVKKILADCKYMQGNISYYDTNGKKQTINKTYIDVIMEAAKSCNISPYHIASRIRQEIGTGDGSVIISGTYGKYKGYYNYFNWGAYGSDIIGSGLQAAKNSGWTDPEKAIKGGVAKLDKEYIGVGQDTLYLQKFDVVDGGNDCYWHQYMTNISASKTEGLTTKNAYLKMGMLSKESKIKFKIPVYKNMPTTKAAFPGKETIVTQDVQLIRETNIRKGKGTNTDIIATLNKDTKMLRIELALSKDSSGIYWDKVILNDNRIGYVTRDNLKIISTQSNCSEKYVMIGTVPLRNGPGTEGTNIVKYLYEGQLVTAIEKDKYNNLNGENWYRVKLTDGNVGYVTLGDAKNPNMIKYDETSNQYEYIEVICDPGLNIRSAPTVKDSTYITTVPLGTLLFRIQKDASTNEGYVWDKIVTDSGIVGYVVKKDKNTGEDWIKEIKNKEENGDENKEEENNTNISGDGFKTIEDNLICEPKMTVEKIKEKAKDAVIKNGDKIINNTESLGTGYTITYNEKTFTVVVLGDVTGTGTITAVDAVRILKKAAGNYELKDAYLSAADVDGDGKVTAIDAVRVLKTAAGKYDLTIK